MKSVKMMAGLGLFALALCTGCSSGKKEKGMAQDERPTVKVTEVTSRPVDQIEEFTATVEPDVKNNIAPSMSVRIEEIFVEVGDRVSKGQQLVQMDQSSLLQSLHQLQNTEIEFQRIDELYKIGGASKSEWDAQKTVLDVARTSYKNLTENTMLLSPVSGIVTARNYDGGDMYGIGGSPVLTIEKITPVKLKINVSESYFSKLKPGMSVRIKLDVYGEEEFAGKVTLIYPTIDHNSRTFPIEISLPNTDQRIRPGMFARVTLSLGVLDHVVVSDRAIVKQTGSGEYFVYVYSDGKVSYNKVELGRRLGNEYELNSGVEPGSQVVIAGQSRLRDGVEVALK